MLLVSITFFVFGAYEMYFTNQTELWFSIQDIFLPCLVSGLIAAALLILITAIIGHFSERAAAVAVSLIFSIGFALYIQGNFAVMDYGVLDGKAIQWENYTVYGVATTIGWLACVIAPLVLLFKKPSWFEKTVNYVSMFIIAMQVITLGTLFVTNDISKTDSAVFTTENQFELSKEKNVVVFIVDSMDAQYVDDMLEEFPEVKEIFKDFTYFDDVVGICPTTKGSLPFILTGVPYFNEKPYQDYLAEAYQQGPIMQTAKENRFAVDIYTAQDFASEVAEGKVTNLSVVRTKVDGVLPFLKTFYKLVSFRYAPHYLKNYFWMANGEFETYKAISNEIVSYSEDNLNFYQDLLASGLQANRENPVMKVYHIVGTHSPFKHDENLNKVEADETSGARQCRGCFKIVEEFIDQLRTLDIYDTTSIVIMADHGCFLMNQNPGVLTKRAETEQPALEVNSAPISYVSDWPESMISLIAEDKQAGNTFFEIRKDEPRIRQFFYYSWDAQWDAAYMPDIYEYQFSGKAKELERTNDLTGTVYRRVLSGEYQYHVGEICEFGDMNFYQAAVKEGMAESYGLVNGKVVNYAWLEEYGRLELMLAEKPKNSVKMRFQVQSVNGSEQRVEVLVNGTSIGERVFELGTEMEDFLIPQGLIGDKKMVIEFKSPGAFIGQRIPAPVSVALFSIQLMETDETELPPVDFPTINQNITVEFGEGKTPNEIIGVRGIYPSQGSAAWSSEKAKFYFKTDCVDDMNFSIQYGTYYEDLDASVLFNGHEVGRLTASYADETIRLPKEYIQRGGVQTVEVLVPDATSPYLYNGGSDTRILGLCIKSISVDLLIVPTINEDTAMVFQAGDASLGNIMTKGVKAPQGTAAWSGAEMELCFKTDRTEDITFNIVYGTFYKELDAIVTFNGVEVGRLTKSHDNAAIVLPGTLIRAGETQSLVVSVPNATSPKLYGYGPSEEILGLCLNSVSLTF